MRKKSRKMLKDLADITGESQEHVLDIALRRVYKLLNQQMQDDHEHLAQRTTERAAAMAEAATSKTEN